MNPLNRLSRRPWCVGIEKSRVVKVFYRSGCVFFLAEKEKKCQFLMWGLQGRTITCHCPIYSMSNARITELGTTLCHNSPHGELWLANV